jgi:hypothetical protein
VSSFGSLLSSFDEIAGEVVKTRSAGRESCFENLPELAAAARIMESDMDRIVVSDCPSPGRYYLGHGKLWLDNTIAHRRNLRFTIFETTAINRATRDDK